MLQHLLKPIKTILLLLLLFPAIVFGQWIQVGNNINGEAINDQFGYAVSLSANGNIVAIGAPFNIENGVSSGHVRIFENQLGNWVQLGDNINGESSSDKSGFSISLSDDGSIIAIGAPDYTEPSNFEIGQVRVFQNQSGTWTQIGNSIIGEEFSDHSGFSISLSGDGNRIAIGAPNNGVIENVGSNFGHVRIYENQSGTWTQIGGDINGEAPNDNSGHSVSLNQDGTIVAIGAPFNSDKGPSSGHVRVFSYNLTNWIQIGNDIDGEDANDRSGGSVSLNDQGNILAIGAIDNNNAGHVRVFENQSGTWVQIGSDIDGESAGDDFGVSVSLNGNGSIVAIGGYFNDGAELEAGHVRIYKNESNVWTQINNDIDGEALQDRSGRSVSLSADGNIVAIGAHFNDGNGSNSGHARVFNNSGVLSIADTNFENNLLIYPNPVTNRLSIDLKNFPKKLKIAVFDASGKQLYAENAIDSQVLNISTNNYSKGVYFIKITSGNKNTALKFIKI